MNYFLTLVILVLCGGGYYEYTLQQQSNVGYQEKISDLQIQVTKLKADNKQLEDDKEQWAKSLTDAQAKIADLTAKIAAAQKATDDTIKTQAAPPPVVAPAGPTNDLGTISTLDGKTFENCKLLRVEVDGITFNHSAGITKVLFPLLPLDTQKKFGFDMHNGSTLTPDQVQDREQQRIEIVQKELAAQRLAAQQAAKAAAKPATPAAKPAVAPASAATTNQAPVPAK